MRRAALLGAVTVLVLGGIFVVRPFVAQQRDTPAAVPSPASLLQTDTVPLRRGAPVCSDLIAIERHSEQLRFKIFSPDGPAPALRVRLRGPSYDYTGEVPAGAGDGAVIPVAIPAPPTDLPIEVCISSLGRPEIGLYASNDRTRSRSVATVGGEPTTRSVWLSFHENAPHAITERLSATVDRMTVFRPGWVGRPLLWALLVLLVVGMPAAVVWAYVRGLSEDERAAPAELDVSAPRSWWRRLVDGP